MQWMQSMQSLTKPNKYGECVAEDAAAIADAIVRYIGRHGAIPELNQRRMIIQILQYIALRRKTHFLHISSPNFTPSAPDGWSSHEEELWQEWIDHTFTIDDWNDDVMNPIFGSDVRLWEANVEGWREELLNFLPWWIKRSAAIVAKFDPAQLPETIDEEKSKLDPYLLEHGSSRQKRMALKIG